MGSKLALVLMAFLPSLFLGCGPVAKVTGGTWQQKCGWKAKDFFDDPQVIALCDAIEKNDVAEIDRLVSAGANVNAKGKGNMTPLLWAFFDNRPERFKRMLEHGADPNVVLDEEFNVRGWFSRGESVTHLACRSEFAGYFEAVFAYGGDPNLISTTRLSSSESPLIAVLTGSATDKKAKVKLLIEKGADLDFVDGSGLTATMTAVGWGGQFETALMLLEAGADPGVYAQNKLQRVVHILARKDDRVDRLTPKQRVAYDKLVKWLEDHGQSLDKARADVKRWSSWSRTSGEYREKADAEIAQRKSREAKALKKKKPDAQKPSE